MPSLSLMLKGIDFQMRSPTGLPSEASLSVPNRILLDILRCPACKGVLSPSPEKLVCLHCQRAFPIVMGIPDLRVYEDPLIPRDDDYRKGEKIQAAAEHLGFADLVRYYWSLPTYPPTPPDLSERFMRHVLSDEQRIEAYKCEIGRGESFLDIGCGTAALVKVARQSFAFAVGCDVAFRWLLIARKRLHEAGVKPNLVCCCADYLPFAEGFFDSVAAVSLLEHISEPAATIREMRRVAKPDGRIFVWTANRFSLAPEPHVRVWGVGFLPRRWMPAYVRWRRGMVYDKKRLLSWFELRKLLKRAGLHPIRFLVPVITAADWDNLKGFERAAARIYVWLARFALCRGPLIVVSPALLAAAGRGNPPQG
jgi:ubiquinone/menaquinone biosynthesis C-methylase UbiE/uncharacterized protein YbaR (Trm112 family)